MFNISIQLRLTSSHIKRSKTSFNEVNNRRTSFNNKNFSIPAKTIQNERTVVHSGQQGHQRMVTIAFFQMI